MESIRNIEDEEIKLLKLQKQYRNGEIKRRRTYRRTSKFVMCFI